MFENILDRLTREPVVIVALIAATIDLLVILGVLDTPVADQVEVVIVAALNVALVAVARSKVAPVSSVNVEDVDDDSAPDMVDLTP